MDVASKFWFRKAELPRKLPRCFQALFVTEPPMTEKLFALRHAHTCAAPPARTKIDRPAIWRLY
jgi:hypothetical protein